MNNIKTNLLFFTLTLLIFAAYFFVWFVTPSTMILSVQQVYGLGNEKTALLHQYFNEWVWVKMKMACTGYFIFIIYLYVYDRLFFLDCWYASMTFCHMWLAEFRSLSIKRRYVLSAVLLLFFSSILVYCAYTPWQLDELDTWMFFVNRGPLISAIYYPSNNNHIAYSILSVFWNLFLSPLWAVRMVSILSSVGTVVVFYFILRSMYSEFLSCVGVLLLMTAAPFVWYAVQGRGYELELFLLTVMLWIILILPADKLTDRLLIILNALTAYVVPVALIPIVLLTLYYAYSRMPRKKKSIQRLLCIAVYTIIGMIILYTPVWILSDGEQLFNNPFVKRISFSEAPLLAVTVYWPTLWSFISGCGSEVGLFLFHLILVGGLYSLLIKRKTKSVVLLIILLFPALLLLFYPVLLFERTWLWLLIPYCWCWVELFSQVFDTSNWKYIPIALLMVFLIGNNVMRLAATNRLIVKTDQEIKNIQRYVAVHCHYKKIQVCDEVLYDYLLFYRTEYADYTLMTCQIKRQGKPDVILDRQEHYRPAEGHIVWRGREHIGYVPN